MAPASREVNLQHHGPPPEPNDPRPDVTSRRAERSGPDAHQGFGGAAQDVAMPIFYVADPGHKVAIRFAGMGAKPLHVLG